MRESIPELRDKIKHIDEKLVQLLRQRIEIVIHIGQLKNASGIPVLDKTQEKEVLSHILSLPHSPVRTRHLEEIFNLIIHKSRQIQVDDSKRRTS